MQRQTKQRQSSCKKQFDDKLVSQGRDGGKEAARLLKLKIHEHLKDEDISESVTIVIRVFANLQGLGRIYQNSNIVSATSIKEEFIRGFNMGDPMCDYVDAGKTCPCDLRSTRKSALLAELYSLTLCRKWKRMCGRQAERSVVLNHLALSAV